MLAAAYAAAAPRAAALAAKALAKAVSLDSAGGVACGSQSGLCACDERRAKFIVATLIVSSEPRHCGRAQNSAFPSCS